MAEKKGKKVFIPADAYANLAMYAKATNRTVDETANDLLQLGTKTLQGHMIARKVLNGKD